MLKKEKNVPMMAPLQTSVRKWWPEIILPSIVKRSHKAAKRKNKSPYFLVLSLYLLMIGKRRKVEAIALCPLGKESRRSSSAPSM